MKKRILAVFLAATMLLSILPMTVFATGTSYAITNGSPESAKETNHGYITVNETAAEGETVTVTVNPAEGYQLKSMTVTPVAPTISTIADVLATVEEFPKDIIENSSPTVPSDAWTNGTGSAFTYKNAALILSNGIYMYAQLTTGVTFDDTSKCYTATVSTLGTLKFNMADGVLTSFEYTATNTKHEYDGTYAPASTPSAKRKPITPAKQQNGTYQFTMPCYAVTVTAEFEEIPVTEYPVKVGNTQVTSSNKDDVLGDGKISYDPATQTLTLNNAEIAIDGSMCSSAIYSKLRGDLTIKLVGENQIGAKPTVSTNKSNYKVLCGIAASDDNVTITGDGSLTMYTWMDGIWADNVNIPTDFAGTLTIENYGEVVYITDNVYFSDTPAIRADSNVGIRGGTVNVICHDGGGIYAGEGNIVIEGGATVNVTSDKFSAIKAAPGTIEDDEIIGSYYAGGGDVYIYNGAKVTVNAGTKAEELVTDVYGIYAAGCIEIGFVDEIYDDPTEQPPTPAPEEVSVTVGNTNISGVYDVDGIMSDNGNTSVIGSKVTVKCINGRGFNIGVCGGPECGDIVIIDSTVDVDAGTSGIVAFEKDIDCDVTITNSKVNVKAINWGINAQDDMVITDSKVTVESDTWGIECDTLTVDGTQTQIKTAGGEVGLVIWGGKNALTVKNGSLQLVGGKMALDAGENAAFTMSLPTGYALKGNKEKNVFTDLQNITLKKYSGEDEFYDGHSVSYVGNEPAKSVTLGHNPELVNGKDATDAEAGYKSYYECKICGKYYEDATELVEISNIDEWKSKGGAGYLAPTLIAVDSFDEPVEQGSETYEIKDDGIHVYSNDIIFKGKTNRKFIIESEWQSLNLSDIIVENDLIIDGLSDNVTLNLTNAEIKGNVIAENSNGEMYLCAFIDGENIIGGNVESDGSFTVYGNPDASLSVKSIKTETMLYVSGLRLENMKENYELGETKTATPDDVTKSIKLTVKKNAVFPDEEEFVINGGKPFKFGEKLNIQPPVVCDENGAPFDLQPGLTVVFYRYDDDNEYSYSIVDGVPTEEGKYKVTFYMPEDDLNYTGGGSYDFTIGHNIQMVEGKTATTEETGYKAYYECKGCGKFYEDASGLVEITDLAKWKAEGGNGYIAKLKEEPTNPTDPTSPQTGDNSHMTLWVMLMALSSMGLCACHVLGKKRKYSK